MPDLEQDMPLRDRIKTLLANKFVAPDGKLSVEEIASELEAPTSSVRVVLNRYRERDFIPVDTGTRVGKWALFHKEEA